MDKTTEQNSEVLDETTKNNLALKARYLVRKIGSNSVISMSLLEILNRINREGQLSNGFEEIIDNPDWQRYTIHNNWKAGLKHFVKMELVEVIPNEDAKPLEEKHTFIIDTYRER